LEELRLEQLGPVEYLLKAEDLENMELQVQKWQKGAKTAASGKEVPIVGEKEAILGGTIELGGGAGGRSISSSSSRRALSLQVPTP
jgi:hypothetical protein